MSLVPVSRKGLYETRYPRPFTVSSLSETEKRQYKAFTDRLEAKAAFLESEAALY